MDTRQFPKAHEFESTTLKQRELNVDRVYHATQSRLVNNVFGDDKAMIISLTNDDGSKRDVWVPSGIRKKDRKL